MRRTDAGEFHDAAFYATLLLLSLRCDAEGITQRAALLLAAYDLQNGPPPLAHLPDRGVGRAIAWSTGVAVELLQTDVAAEDAALQIAARYDEWVRELMSEPAAAAARQASTARRQREHEAVVVDLKERVFRRTLALVLTAVFAGALVVVLLKLA